jgi:four helix bundle protein
LGFALRVAKLIDRMNKSFSVFEHSRQVVRSSASIGANMVEADGALTKRDFINKMGIARREARETRFWLILIKELIPIDEVYVREELEWQINEAKELMLILSSIINKTRAKG